MGFNRYMVECKYYQKIATTVPSTTVLIDTWWNVNKIATSTTREILNVLIDTWWNVNMEKLRARYNNSNVLIDTWWNVNYKSPFWIVSNSMF